MSTCRFCGEEGAKGLDFSSESESLVTGGTYKAAVSNSKPAPTPTPEVPDAPITEEASPVFVPITEPAQEASPVTTPINSDASAIEPMDDFDMEMGMVDEETTKPLFKPLNEQPNADTAIFKRETHQASFNPGSERGDRKVLYQENFDKHVVHSPVPVPEPAADPGEQNPKQILRNMSISTKMMAMHKIALISLIAQCICLTMCCLSNIVSVILSIIAMVSIKKATTADTETEANRLYKQTKVLVILSWCLFAFTLFVLWLILFFQE